MEQYNKNNKFDILKKDTIQASRKEVVWKQKQKLKKKIEVKQMKLSK